MEETTWYDQKKFSVTVARDPFDAKIYHVNVGVTPMHSGERYEICKVTTLLGSSVSILLVKKEKSK